MQCLKALHSRNKRPPGEGAPSYEAGPPTSPGSRTPPHRIKTTDKMLRDNGGERLKGEKAVQYGRSVRKNSTTSKGDRNNHNARKTEKTKKGVEGQYNQQRRPKQPQHKNNEKSAWKDSSTNKGDRNNHDAK